MTLKVKELNLMLALSEVNKEYEKANIDHHGFNQFKIELAKLLKKMQSLAEKKGTQYQESEEHYKTLISDFIKDIGYKSKYYVNTKNRIDLAIHEGVDSNSPLGVLFEVKSPTNAQEMITAKNLNTKALQELVYYYLQERITQGNLAVKHLIVTNAHEWFIFDAQEFERIFCENTAFKKQFQEFEGGNLSVTKTKNFYEEIAAPFIEKIEDEIAYVHLNLDDYAVKLQSTDPADEKVLIKLYKILSPEHLLKIPFKNDSNSLNKKFYNELLYIIGLTETGKQKKTIERCPINMRQSGVILEEIITLLKSKDKIRQLPNVSQYGSTEDEQLFNIALELAITWVNRILFLKLLEAQLVSYHQGDGSYSFLSHTAIKSYGDLDDLFFQVLAIKQSDRNQETQEKFAKVPYLNSTLFAPTELEQKTLFVDNLNNKLLPIFVQTVLTDEKRIGKIGSLEYLLKFLDAYDFGSEKGSKFQSQDRLINASVLGLIFEKINGYKDGSHFTPGFITEYMCRESIREAVVRKFNKVKEWDCKEFKELYNKIDDIKEANEIVNSLKICDPAVGSGHFLVSALNEIIAIKHDLRILCDREGNRLKEYEIKIVEDELQITEKGKPFVYHPKDIESHRVQETLFHEKQTIIENCLFGVDINPNSVAICRLRLWIELLKNAYYKSDTELETLPNIDINIKCGNSLVSRFLISDSMTDVLKGSSYTIKKYRAAIADYRNAKSKEQKRAMEDLIAKIKSDFRGSLQRLFPLFEEEKDEVNNKIYQNAFEWRFEFPEVLDDKGEFIGFDVVIGNPPYVSTKGTGPALKEELERHFGFSDDLYYHFAIKGFNLLCDKGILAFITPDTYFTTLTKAGLRKEFLANTILSLAHLGHGVFDDVIVSTAIIIARKAKFQGGDFTILDARGKKKLADAVHYRASQTLFGVSINGSFFVPDPQSFRINEKLGLIHRELINDYWNIIEKADRIKKNAKTLNDYRKKIKPGDWTLVGLVTEGGVGLQTGNNGKFIGVKSNCKEAAEIRKKRIVELAEVNSRYNTNYILPADEFELWELFEKIKTTHGRDVFGQGYLYKIVPDSLCADVAGLSDREKAEGIIGNRVFVPYDKGDKDGNRWYLETPYLIAWSTENVTFLKENSGKKEIGMPVVRNPQFYFREGFCWSDVKTTYLKCRLKPRSIHDVKSMSLFVTTEVVPEYYILSLINSKLVSELAQTFLNNTSSFQLNDCRALPIPIPTATQLEECKHLFDAAVSIQKSYFQGILSASQRDTQLRPIQEQVDHFVENLYDLTEDEIKVVEGTK